MPDTGRIDFLHSRASISVSLSTRTSPLGTHLVCDLFITNEADRWRSGGAISKWLHRVLSYIIGTCMFNMARRSRPARRRTTAASCGRARTRTRTTAPRTPDTRCPCATHDRYSLSTFLTHHPHAGYLTSPFCFYTFSITLLHDL